MLNDEDRLIWLLFNNHQREQGEYHHLQSRGDEKGYVV